MPLRRIEPSYFNPRSSCEERPAREKPSRRQGRISIHAPHARSDPPCRIRCAMSSAKISIHAPHARSDYYTTYTAQKSRNFNPRSSCEERQGKFCMVMHSHDFNPRSSCEERRALKGIIVQFDLFQSTLLMRGATVEVEKLKSINSISIHAPHARSDDRCHKGCGCHAISIHAPHARSDTMPSSRHSSMTTFQSTLLMRGATTDGSKFHTIIIFQSTLLMRGATLKSFAPAPVNEFQSTLLMRGATRSAARA